MRSLTNRQEVRVLSRTAIRNQGWQAKNQGQFNVWRSGDDFTKIALNYARPNF
jgi:hypothetical protein